MRAHALAIAVALLYGPAHAGEPRARAEEPPAELTAEDLELLRNLDLMVDWELLQEWDPATPPPPDAAGSRPPAPDEEEDRP